MVVTPIDGTLDGGVFALSLDCSGANFSQPHTIQLPAEQAVQLQAASCSTTTGHSTVAEVVHMAASACRPTCTREMAACLAGALQSKLPGAQVFVCTSSPSDQLDKRASGAGSNNTKRLWSLSHSFVIVHTGQAEIFIVEPDFRSHFELPRASKDYAAFLGSLPQLLVVEARQMQALVASISRYVAWEFKRMDLPLPPWRSTSALQSRWRCELLQKEYIAPCPAQSPAACQSMGRSHCDPGGAIVSPRSKAPDSSSTPPSSSPISHSNSAPQLVVHGFQLPEGGAHPTALAAASAPTKPAAWAAASAAPASTVPGPASQPAAAPSNCILAPLPPATKPKAIDLQKIFTVRRRASASRQGGMQAALGLAAAATAISTHTPTWWEAVGNSRREHAAAANAMEGSNSRSKGGIAGVCVCIECGYGVGPPIYKAKMVGLAVARAHALQ